MQMFKVLPEHGRVKRVVKKGLRVVVAVPGDEIPLELAEQCQRQDGSPLVKKAKPAPKPKPAPKAKAEPKPKPADSKSESSEEE